MSHVDGVVLPVEKNKRDTYQKHASTMAKVFKQHGALSVSECWGVNVPDGEVTSFSKAVQLKENECVCFSWIIWPSKQVRDDAWEKIHEDKQFAQLMQDMPFDGKRLIYGEFETIVSA